MAGSEGSNRKSKGDLSGVLRDLMQAIVRQETAEARVLLDRAPALVNRVGPHPMWGGRPQPLHVAIESGNRAAFDLLLDRGADVDGDNSQYDLWSPLMLAIHWNRAAMRDELLRRGARIGLIEALMLGDDDRVTTILRDEPDALRLPVPNEATPLHFARSPRAARLLLDTGADIEAKDKYGATPLQRLA